MKNKLRSVRNGSTKAAVHQSQTAAPAAPDPLCARYWNGRKFNEARWLGLTFPIWIRQTGAGGSLHRESFHRDLAGNLFILRGVGKKVTLRSVAYVDACAWLDGSTGNRTSQEYLAFHGINPPPPPSNRPDRTDASHKFVRECAAMARSKCAGVVIFLRGLLESIEDGDEADAVRGALIVVDEGLRRLSEMERARS
jgi:hypothetical protein